MLQYHFDLCLEPYAEDIVVIFAENEEEAWEKVKVFVKTKGLARHPEATLRQLRRAEYAPEVRDAFEPVHFAYYE